MSFTAGRRRPATARPPSATAARCTTAGRPAGGASPATTGRSSAWGCPGWSAGWSSTSPFTGNYPPEVSVEGASAEGYPTPDELQRAAWTALVPRSPVGGDTANRFEVTAPHRVTHVRLCSYPDGGVARLRVHGEPVPDPRQLPPAGSTLPSRHLASLDALPGPLAAHLAG